MNNSTETSRLKGEIFTASEEIENRNQLLELFKNCQVPEEEALSNLGLFLTRTTLPQILFIDEIYRKIIDVHGVVMEFGIKWGRNQALFHSLRGMYEPYNYSRKIIGFDTFRGFIRVDEEDGKAPFIEVGRDSVGTEYKKYLESLLSCHESLSPIGHMKKFELVEGDASLEIHNYLKRNPHTIIALAYMDMDLYRPTVDVLKAIKERMPKGAVIVFDELNISAFPGETVAAMEVLGLYKHSLRRMPNMPMQSYIVLE